MRTWFRRLRQQFSGQKRRRPVRSRRLSLEGLEDRCLLSLSANPNPTFLTMEGQPATGPIAAFHDTDPTAAPGDYTVSINWGDGTPATTGQVVDDGNGNFTVNGT